MHLSPSSGRTLYALVGACAPTNTYNIHAVPNNILAVPPVSLVVGPQVNDDVVVDSTNCGGISRFCNHCCMPSLYTRVSLALKRMMTSLPSSHQEDGDDLFKPGWS